MAVCTCLALCVMPRTPSACTTTGSVKKLRCWPWLLKPRSSGTAVSLRVMKTSGRPLTRPIGRIWRSTLTLQMVKVLSYHCPNGRSHQWRLAVFCKPKQALRKTSRLQPVNTTRPLAKAATSGLEKLFLRASARVMLVRTITGTT